MGKYEGFKSLFKLFDEIFTKHAEYVAEIASVLTAEEQEELSGLLKKLGLGLRERHQTIR